MAADVALEALGNPIRRRIIMMLAPGPRAVGEIAAELPVSRPAVSKHLRLLQHAELVTFDRDGTRNVFRLRREGFDELRGWLESFWDEALANFQEVAEHAS